MKSAIQQKHIEQFISKYILLIIICGILIVESISITRMKPFWLDEWFVIFNIKFKEIDEFFFRPLEFSQGFPRVYLSLLKYFSRTFDYSHLSLVIIPSIIQALNIIFFWHLSKEAVYRENKLKGYFLVLLFLSYKTTFVYFTQIKPYTMELFCSLLAIWQYYEFGRHFKYSRAKDFRFWIAVGILPVAPFLSYSYPIIITPLLTGLFFTFVYTGKTFDNTMKTLFPLALFLISIVIEYYIDIKFALSSNIHRANLWRTYSVSYESLNSFILHLSRSFFVFMSHAFLPLDKYLKDPLWTGNYIKHIIYLFRILIFLIPTVIGILMISSFTIKDFTDSANEGGSFLSGFKVFSLTEYSIRTFFFVLFFAIWVLFLMNLLPIGPKRANYFCIPMLGYLWIEGIYFFKRNKNSFFYLYGNSILISGLISLVVFIGIGYNKEALEKSGSRAQWYHTVGKAIQAAYNTDLPILVPVKERNWKHAAGWHFNLMLKTHPYHNNKKEVKTISLAVIKDKCNDNRNKDLSFIKIKEDRYNIVSLKDFCLSNHGSTKSLSSRFKKNRTHAN